MVIRILSILLLPFVIIAQDANEVFQQLQNKFNNIQDITAEFNQSIISSNNSKIIIKGKFNFKKENSFSILMDGRDIISDGISVWNYDKNQNKVVISLVDSENNSFSLTDIIYSYPEQCNLKLVDIGEYFIIKAVPKETTLSFKEAFLTIDSNYILTQVEITDFNNVKYLFKLSDIKLNSELEDKLFKFIPPNEVEIIDLR